MDIGGREEEKEGRGAPFLLDVTKDAGVLREGKILLLAPPSQRLESWDPTSLFRKKRKLTDPSSIEGGKGWLRHYPHLRVGKEGEVGCTYPLNQGGRSSRSGGK